mmetsp:Transcript_7082/g.19425  ORF Transcript_7082/g.19425 Transcript_7082/m.19425 type:complete len:114 (-) Transcript_7082:3-344(-)
MAHKRSDNVVFVDVLQFAQHGSIILLTNFQTLPSPPLVLFEIRDEMVDLLLLLWRASAHPRHDVQNGQSQAHPGKCITPQQVVQQPWYITDSCHETSTLVVGEKNVEQKRQQT